MRKWRKWPEGPELIPSISSFPHFLPLIRSPRLLRGRPAALSHELEELLPLRQAALALVAVDDHLAHHPDDRARAEVEPLVELLHRLEHLAAREARVLDREV